MMRTIFLCLTLTFSWLFAQADSYNLPEIGNSSGGVLSPVQESTLGIQYFQALKSELPLLNDPFIVQYVQQLGKLLVSNSNAPHQHFYFFVVNSSSVNAFAGPDGYVAINTGLILTAKSEGEVAAVLAHEIAHVTQRHIARSIAEAKRLQIADIAGVLAGLAVGMNSPQAGAGLATAASAGALQKSLNYSRGYEEEADRFGMQTLAKSGFNPKNMPDFFTRLEDISRANGGEDETFALLMTHPVTAARIADADNRLNSIRVAHPRPNNPYFYLIQARTLIMTSRDVTELSRYLATQLAARPNNIAIRYSYTLSLIKSDQFSAADKQISLLLTQDPTNILFLVAKSSLLLAEHKTNEGLAILSQLQQKNPTNLAILLQYAQALIISQQFDKARLILSQNLSRYRDHESFLTLLSQAQGRAGKLADAYETRSKILQLNHDFPGAILQLEQALQFSKDPYQKARINFELNQLKRSQKLDEKY